MFRIKKIRPMFTGIVTTAHTYSEDVKTESGIFLGGTKTAGSLNVNQWVLAVGPMVKDINVGDIVHINFKRYMVANHVPGKIEDNIQKDMYSARLEVPAIEIDGQTCLMLQNNDIEYVIEDYDGIEAGGLLE